MRISPEQNAQLTDALQKMRATDEGYFGYGAIAWDALPSSHREQLSQLLFQGPVWDGYIISKADRDDLIDLGLAVRCCFQGEQGYTAATYIAYSIFKQGGGIPIKKRAGVPG